MCGVTTTLAVRSCLSNMSSFAPCETFDEPLSTPPTLTSATIMPAPTDMQESPLSHNEFALCLQSLLRPSSALSPCEFTTCMRALIPSPFPACLRSLQRPSLALSPSEFESFLRALTPAHVQVPTGFRQFFSRPGQPDLPMTGLTTRAFHRPLLLATLRVLKFSDDIVFLVHSYDR